MKPFSQACENNKAAILAVLTKAFSTATHILEIGSGTGQHAVFFAQHLPTLFWQTSDRPHNHYAIQQWLASTPATNVGQPLVLDVTCPSHWQPLFLAQSTPQSSCFDGLFTANTAHIMPWSAVVATFVAAGQLLQRDDCLVWYGPFNRDGGFTSESNAAFHHSLQARHPHMGLRDDRALLTLGHTHDFALTDDVAMPANNRMLIFTKIASPEA